MSEKPSFEKMINSSQNIVPKRLSFDFLNNSNGDGGQSKKRRINNDFSVYEDQSTISKTMNDTLNSSLGSASGSAPSWEVKMLRIDLTEAQTRVRTF